MPGGRRRGFTLIESVVALAIVGAVAVSVLELLSADLRGAEKARTALIASSLGRARLARLELATAAELPSLPDSLRRGRFDSPFEAYSWNASAVAISGELDLYDARVAVTGPNGATEIRTRLYRPVPQVAAR